MILQTNDHVTFIKSIIRNASEEGRCVNEIESEEIANSLKAMLQETNTYCSVLLGCETETKPISNEQYMLIVPKGTITGSDELVFE